MKITNEGVDNMWRAHVAARYSKLATGKAVCRDARCEKVSRLALAGVRKARAR